MLLIVSITLLLIILISISFYNFYLLFKYLFIKDAHSDSIHPNKTQSFIKKVQSVISLMVYYSIGGGYGESIKLFDDIYFIDNDDENDLFIQYKSTTRKLTSIMHKITAIIVLLILLLIALAMIS